MISYYELLTMVKEGKEPKRIKVYLTSTTSAIYCAEYDLDKTFNYYGLENNHENDGNYKYYLGECFLESSMFDKNIEILDKKEIKKIEFDMKDFDKRIMWFDKEGKHHFNTNSKDRFFANKINEIIDIIKELREEKI